MTSDNVGASVPAADPAPGEMLGESAQLREPFIDLDRVLTWIGIFLLGSFLVNSIASAIPLRLTDPVWINAICTILRGSASFPLVGLVFILLGAYLDGPAKEPRPITRIRRLSMWVAIGFLLMIPLQAWAGFKLIDQSVEAQKQTLEPARQALRNIYASTSPQALLSAMRTIPGAPPNLSGRFDEPYEVVRQQLIRQMEPEIRSREAQLSLSIQAIRRNGLVGLFKDGAIGLLTSIAFAAIGRSRPYRPTLLLAITRPGSLNHKVPDDVERWLDEAQRKEG